MGEFIYLDHAATTQTAPEVLDAMLPYLQEYYGNPSSSYRLAVSSRKAVEKARGVIADMIHAKEQEIFFTGGGTESDNWALKAVAESLQKKGRHIITTQIEHHAILHTCEYLEKRGFEVTYLPVNEQGFVSPHTLKQAIRKDTVLISVMFANNEIGTLQPVSQIGQIAHERGILFHTDAVQAFCQMSIDVREMQIDLMSASGHKCYGPKGVGFLYVGERVPMTPFLHGGAQERKLRAGTENVAGIVGFGAAVAMCKKTLLERAEKERVLRDHLIDRILSEVPYTRLNGSRKMRLPNNANFSFQFIEGENLLVLLDMDGICASGGSACTTGSTEPSHVLKAIGLPDGLANGSLRLTLGAGTSMEEIDRTVEAVKKHVAKLRDGSVVYEDFLARQWDHSL